MSQRIAVVGAGIFGLSLTYYLKRKGIEVDLFEQSECCGGVINTKRQEGFILEEGPNTVLMNQEVENLINDLGLSEETIKLDISKQNKYIATFQNKTIKLEKAPSSFSELIKTPLLSVTAKFRVFFELFKPKCKLENPSVRQFISHRFGKEFADIFFSAFLNGIWAGNIDNLSAKEVLPALYKLEQKNTSILRAKLFNIFQQKKSERKVFFTFRQGIFQLVRNLRAKLDDNQVFNKAEVSSLKDTSDTVELTYIHNGQTVTKNYDKVFLSSSFNDCKLILNKSNLNPFSGFVDYCPLSLAHYEISKDENLKFQGFGFLTPTNKITPLLGAIFNTSLFPSRAQDDKHLLTTFVGGSEHASEADFSDINLQLSVATTLKQALNLSKEPKLLNYKYYAQAIPQYNLNHPDLVKQVQLFNSQSNIQIVGNWVKGISVADRIKEAYEIASSI